MTPELQSYYADRKQTWRNLTFISICNLGWGIGPSMFMPLMTLVLYDMGMHERMQGVLGMVNSWLVAYLVMYFSWSSDHTVSRIGRRKIYLMLAAPFIIVGRIWTFHLPHRRSSQDVVFRSQSQHVPVAQYRLHAAGIPGPLGGPARSYQWPCWIPGQPLGHPGFECMTHVGAVPGRRYRHDHHHDHGTLHS